MARHDIKQNTIALREGGLTDISQTGATGDAGDQYTGLDRFGRVVEQNWYDPSTGSSVVDLQYGYDADGNVVYRSDAVNPASSELYGYDALNQLTSFARGTLNADRTAVAGTPGVSEGWTYDALGNRTSATATTPSGTTAAAESSNALNEITSIGGSAAVAYDADGNMTVDQDGLTYVYDAWNRLVAVKDASGATLETNGYDGLGDRVTNTAGSTMADFYYSSKGQVVEERSGGAYTARHVWSPASATGLVLRDADTSGTGLTATGTGYQRLWAVQDADSNVVALVSGSGAVVERYAYDPFGAQTVHSPAYVVTSASQFGWLYGFQGMRADPVTGQDQTATRNYDPAVGAWTSADPLGLTPDVNDYRFEGNNSILSVDPSGEWAGVLLALSAPVGGALGYHAAESNGGNRWAGAAVGYVVLPATMVAAEASAPLIVGALEFVAAPAVAAVVGAGLAWMLADQFGRALANYLFGKPLTCGLGKAEDLALAGGLGAAGELVLGGALLKGGSAAEGVGGLASTEGALARGGGSAGGRLNAPSANRQFSIGRANSTGAGDLTELGAYGESIANNPAAARLHRRLIDGDICMNSTSARYSPQTTGWSSTGSILGRLVGLLSTPVRTTTARPSWGHSATKHGMVGMP